MYNQKSMVVLAGLVLVAVSIMSAPASVADSRDYIGPYVIEGNDCADPTLLACFVVAGDEVTVVIEDASGLEVNGLLRFQDANGDTFEEHPFCGDITQVVPSDAQEIEINRYISPPPVVNGCTEVFWTTGTITVTWDP